MQVTYIPKKVPNTNSNYDAAKTVFDNLFKTSNYDREDRFILELTHDEMMSLTLITQQHDSVFGGIDLTENRFNKAKTYNYLHNLYQKLLKCVHNDAKIKYEDIKCSIAAPFGKSLPDSSKKEDDDIPF